MSVQNPAAAQLTYAAVAAMQPPTYVLVPQAPQPQHQVLPCYYANGSGLNYPGVAVHGQAVAVPRFVCYGPGPAMTPAAGAFGPGLLPQNVQGLVPAFGVGHRLPGISGGGGMPVVGCVPQFPAPPRMSGTIYYPQSFDPTAVVLPGGQDQDQTY
jgi:hypothetical protein